MRRLWRLIDHLVDGWLRTCEHRGEHVAADILEGNGGVVRVLYCRRCGAVRPSYAPEWRRPQPTWYPREGGER